MYFCYNIVKFENAQTQLTWSYNKVSQVSSCNSTTTATTATTTKHNIDEA